MARVARAECSSRCVHRLPGWKALVLHRRLHRDQWPNLRVASDDRGAGSDEPWGMAVVADAVACLDLRRWSNPGKRLLDACVRRVDESHLRLGVPAYASGQQYAHLEPDQTGPREAGLLLNGGVGDARGGSEGESGGALVGAHVQPAGAPV